MVTLYTATTDHLTPSVRRRIRTLLASAFGGDFSEHDWAHASGGTHVWLSDSTDVISHASRVERTFVCGSVTLSVAYVASEITCDSPGDVW